MPLTIWYRRFQPAALALACAAFALGGTWLISERFEGFAHWMTVVWALGVGGLLAGAWLAHSKAAMDWGYLASTGLWIFVAWAALVSGLSWTSILLALAWAVLAGGSYLLEVRDGDGRWLP